MPLRNTTPITPSLWAACQAAFLSGAFCGNRANTSTRRRLGGYLHLFSTHSTTGPDVPTFACYAAFPVAWLRHVPRLTIKPSQMMRSVLILLMFTSLASGMAFAEIRVAVAERYRAVQYQSNIDLKPGEYLSFDMPLNKFGDEYTVQTAVNATGVELLVLDGRDRDTDNPHPIPLLRKPVSSEQVIRLEKPPSSSGLMGMLLNRSDKPIHLVATVARVGKRPKAVTDQIRRIVAAPFDALAKTYGPGSAVAVLL